LAWVQIRRLGLERASESVTLAIRQFAAHQGHADRYHDTLTRFWLRAVSLGIKRHPALAFSKLMGSDEARRQWVEPDLRLMPAS
jgi:hypothetical protein